MDLKALMNDDEKPEGRPGAPLPQRSDSSRPAVFNAQPPTPTAHGLSYQWTPQRPPPLANLTRPYRDGTPPLPSLATLAQHSSRQSPTGPPYRQYESSPANTPTSASQPPSHGRRYRPLPQPPPLTGSGAGAQSMAQSHFALQEAYDRSATPLSPTLSSHHSQPPTSVRRSSHSVFPQPPSSQKRSHPPKSQTSTPLPRSYDHRGYPYSANDAASPEQQRAYVANGEAAHTHLRYHSGASIIPDSPRVMDMNNLLSPAPKTPPLKSAEFAQNGTLQGQTQSEKRPSPYKPGCETLGKHAQSAPPPLFTADKPARSRVRPEPGLAETAAQSPTELSTSPAPQLPRSATMPQAKGALKRPAESLLAAEPAFKHQKTTRKYTEPPVWARLSKHNPRCGGAGSKGPARHAQSSEKTPAVQQPHGHTNGASKNAAPSRDAPLDYDLIRAREVMGAWEKTFRWNTPTPDIVQVVSDWLYLKLESLRDVGTDNQHGMVEIEAKVGTLFKADSDERCNLPVSSSTVIDPVHNHRYRFESRMNEAEHAHMNQSLNKAIAESIKGENRISMVYKHHYETDTFERLSKAGIAALPPSIRNSVQLGRDPKLRTTTRDSDSAVLARIVKINIDHLHIFNPRYNYDCRISINVEVNLDRPELDPAELVDVAGTAVPARKKDRLSYKHLIYSIDLTKVMTPGLAPKYELELEIEAQALRDQIRRIHSREPHAYSEVVQSFLDNVTYLMREGP